MPAPMCQLRAASCTYTLKHERNGDANQMPQLCKCSKVYTATRLLICSCLEPSFCTMLDASSLWQLLHYLRFSKLADAALWCQHSPPQAHTKGNFA